MRSGIDSLGYALLITFFDIASFTLAAGAAHMETELCAASTRT